MSAAMIDDYQGKSSTFLTIFHFSKFFGKTFYNFLVECYNISYFFFISPPRVALIERKDGFSSLSKNCTHSLMRTR